MASVFTPSHRGVGRNAGCETTPPKPLLSVRGHLVIAALPAGTMSGAED